MFNVVSLLIGLVALPFALVGIIPFPFVPLINWIAFPIALTGTVVGMLSRDRGAEPQPADRDHQRGAADAHGRVHLGKQKGARRTGPLFAQAVRP
ncbi:hypothetical protein [Sphingomonas sp.]|uniref:hypothetical protein n=1 Tax=Sphingomonas sp. TaxID=28214 RepID=UPI002FDB78A8